MNQNSFLPKLPRIGSGRLLKFLYIICLLFSISSCEFFTKAQDSNNRRTETEKIDPVTGTLVYDPVKGEWVRMAPSTPTEKMDTINWVTIPENQFTPIIAVPTANITPIGGNNNTTGTISTDQFGSQMKPSYNMAFLLPFLSDQFDPLSAQFNSISEWSLNYLCGSKMALKRLENEGVNLKLDIIDSKANEQEVQIQLQNSPLLKQADLIVGPYRRDNIRMVAEYAKRNNITMVSPYSASANLSNENPNYLQVSPNLKSHCKAITYFARQKFKPNQIVILYQDNAPKQQTAQYFQEANILYSEGMPTDRMIEYSLPDGQIPTADDLNLSQFMSSGDSIAFFIPAWSRNDENFVYVTLSQISLEKDPFQYVEVYGLPQWQQYEKIDLDYFEKLNVHISSNLYIDETNQDIRQFRRDFYDQFGLIAPYEAYLGYDVTLFTGRMLQKYGNKFQYHLDKESPQYLHTQFQFQKVLNSTNNGFEQAPIEQFENQFVNILKFENYRFQKVN